MKLSNPSSPRDILAPVLMNQGTGTSGGGGVAAPEIPGSFAATPGDRQITLSWESQPAADTFTIRYGLVDDYNSAGLLTDAATGTNFVFDSGESIQAGEKFYFWIVAVNGAGSSAESGSITGRAYVTLANSASANLTTPAGSWILSTLFFRTGGNLPVGCNVTFNGSSEVGTTNGDGTWEDGINGGAFDPSISGAFTFDNNSGSSLTFWDTEP